jgi:hypothetical protein
MFYAAAILLALIIVLVLDFAMLIAGWFSDD